MPSSRNHFHTVAREFGMTSNGSLPAYGAVGEMRSQRGHIAPVSRRKVTMLGQNHVEEKALSVTQALGGAGMIAVGMNYFGMDMPYSEDVINWTKDRIDQPYQTTQYLMLGTGILILATRAAR